jgi:hypothetical protein
VDKVLGIRFRIQDCSGIGFVSSFIAAYATVAWLVAWVKNMVSCRLQFAAEPG